MQIFCIDKSGGRLFFADDFLFDLCKRESEIVLYIPESQKDNYKPFFKFFPNIKITTDTESVIKDIPQLIFTNYENLKNARQNSDSLIFPIITAGEYEKFSRFLKNLDTGFKNNLIQLDESEKQSAIFKPVSKWAMDHVLRRFTPNPLNDKKILISAGPTVEDIDPVRYISNRSSGKMGIALARAAFIHGAEVNLVYGPGSVMPPDYLNVTRVKSAEDMCTAIMNNFKSCDIYIGSAAVADFTPSRQQAEKIKKKDGFTELLLKPTKDILREIALIKNKQIVIGFSVETVNTIENSKLKLEEKKLDLIVVNNPRDKNSAFDADTNLVSIINKDGSIDSWPLMSKLDVAEKLMQKIAEAFD
ncbi:MAG: phosphopantothenoylcysteine decarboxylase [Calditrichaceae bacterium]|jgi:phosphopantothenoylcysteine synthetase/decarboxylase